MFSGLKKLKNMPMYGGEGCPDPLPGYHGVALQTRENFSCAKGGESCVSRSQQRLHLIRRDDAFSR